MNSISSSCLNHQSVLFALSLRKVLGVSMDKPPFNNYPKKRFFASLFFPSKHDPSFFDNHNNILAVKNTRKRVTKCLEQTKKARCVEGGGGGGGRKLVINI